MVKISCNGNEYYSRKYNGTDYGNIEGECWKIIDEDGEPLKWNLKIKFNKIKKPG